MERYSSSSIDNKVVQHDRERPYGQRGRQGAIDNRSDFAQVTLQHEAAFKRIHRAVDPGHRVQQPIVEDKQAIEPQLDQRIEKPKRPLCASLCSPWTHPSM
jgi:hypothetical protein